MYDNSSAVTARKDPGLFAQDNISILITIEKIGAAFSLLGAVLVFLSYWAFKRMRSLPNLFILLASIANVGASIACVIGYDGIRAGEHLALCQAQGFLIETFIQSDPLWSFAMAINALLVVFFGVSPSSIRRYIWVYCIICFAGPFILGLTFLLIRPEGQAYSIYGDAALWCWITTKWSSLRIYTCYIPVWCSILGSAIVYFAVGCHVFHHRNQLRNLAFSRRNENPSNGPRAALDVQIPCSALINDAVNAEAQAQGPWHMSGEQAALPGSLGCKTVCYSSAPPFEPQRSILRRGSPFKNKILPRLENFDPIKLAYLRVCSLFAVSVLITWTPSSINVIHEYVKPNQLNFGLNVACAVVLPLQGVWNAVIFLVTNWSTFRQELAGLQCCRLVRCLVSLGDSHRRRTRSEMLRGNPEQLSGRGRDLPNSDLEMMAPS
ncbi:hypothetical protein LZ32DRAFT_529908 [Colletotrichum eremochloae]|nr:hypothetical protein LZ32DRAFT_529908 [Colletotrichum eremochloae]